MTDWSRFITAGVGPIIVISACGLLCLAFYNRLAAIVTRLRGFQRERLHEQESLARGSASTSPDEVAMVRSREIIGMLEVQTRQVLRRARLIRSTLLCLLLSIALLASCSLSVGLSIVWPSMIYAAVVLFVFGLGLMIVGVVLAMIELQGALDPVELESKFVRDIVDDFERV